MQDACHIMEYVTDSDDLDAYGLPIKDHRARVSSVCGVSLVSAREIQASGEVPVIDANLRLPIATDVKETDRIRITHRYGTELDTPQDFTIEGPVLRGPSGIRLKLRKVDDGTDTSS
jgi:hypothetical protein